MIKPGSDKPGQAIIDSAVENQCEMIVSGTRGLDEHKRMKLGSVSDYLVRKSPVPVMVCPKETDRY